MTFQEKANSIAVRLVENIDYLNKIDIDNLNIEEKNALFKLKNHAKIYADTLEELVKYAQDLVRKGEQGTIMSILKNIEEYNKIIENLDL